MTTAVDQTDTTVESFTDEWDEDRKPIRKKELSVKISRYTNNPL